MSDTRKNISKTSWGINILIIVCIISVVNFLSYQIFYRWDLTAGNDYSISKTSKNAIANLDDIVNVKVYFSKNLPPQYINLRQEVGDILDEYSSYSNGKIKVQFMEPDDGDETARDLYMKGIPQLQFNSVEKDKLQVIKGYLGMLISQGGREEPIAVVQNTENLEYQLTIAIKKVTATETTTVGFLSSNGAKDGAGGYSAANQKLSEIYSVSKVDLTDKKEIDSNIKTLIIIGPTDKFEEDQLKAIDSFLMRGGSLLVLVDGITVGDGLAASQNESNFFELLSKYGIIVNKDLVVDYGNNGMASFNQGFITFTVGYPFWPKVVESGFDKNNAAVAKLESLVLPWVSDIKLDNNLINDSFKVSYLAKSSESSGLIKDNFNLAPNSNISTADNGSKNLAVSVSGTFASAYEKGKTGAARIIVVGDSDFPADNFLRQYGDNLIFFQNIVDSITLDEDLINIRSKGISEHPVKELSDASRAGIRYANVFGITLFVIILGVVRYFLRRRNKFSDEL